VQRRSQEYESNPRKYPNLTKELVPQIKTQNKHRALLLVNDREKEKD